MNYPADADLVLDLIQAFRRSKTMFTAVQFGLFDRLEKTAKPCADLAKELDANEAALLRLLNGCVALGLLEKENGWFQNTPAASQFLASSSMDSLAGYIRYSNESLYPLWGRLEEAVRTGSNRWEEVFGSRTALFDHYFRNEESAASFIGGMHAFGQLASGRVVTAFDLSRFKKLVDLGGATGHLCIAACREYPDLEAVVLDLAKVEKFARAYIEQSGYAHRIGFIPADFFADSLPKADLYALGRIIHDWTAEKIARLLDKIIASLPANGGLLIAETLLNEDKTGPIYSAMQDLNMLVCTEGRERTQAEYSEMLLSAGFSSVNFKKTGSLVDVILAIKG